MNGIRRGIAGSAAALALALALPAAGAAQTDFEVQSPAFDDGGSIPEENSAYGENVSPELTWSGVPGEARSFALVMEDPDAPTPQPFVHWIVYNIPGDAGGLPEGLPEDEVLEGPTAVEGATQGPGGLGQIGYFGPRPPAESGAHRYYFTVYALDVDPDLPVGLDREELMDRVGDSILGEGEVMGTYDRVE